jgi:hypothetical protein
MTTPLAAKGPYVLSGTVKWVCSKCGPQGGVYHKVSRIVCECGGVVLTAEGES